MASLKEHSGGSAYTARKKKEKKKKKKKKEKKKKEKEKKKKRGGGGGGGEEEKSKKKKKKAISISTNFEVSASPVSNFLSSRQGARFNLHCRMSTPSHRRCPKP